MVNEPVFLSGIRKNHSVPFRRILSAACVPIGALLLLLFPGIGSDGVKAGLSLCGGALIPSVFPFLILTPFLAAYGQQIPGLPVLPLAFCIGMTAGFPLGALTVISLYESGALDRETAERALAVCSGSGPAFLIGCAGKTLGGSAAVGWCYVLAQLCASLVLYRFFLRKKSIGSVRSVREMPTLVTTITNGAVKMADICAFVLFFSVWNRYLSSFCGKFGVLPTFTALLCGCTEMTGGLSMLSSCAGGVTSGTVFLPLSAFLIGFGGFCVYLQAKTFAERAGLSMRYWLPQKLLCGILSALFSAAANLFFFRA